MPNLHTEKGIFPMNNLKDYGEYIVAMKGGKLIQHTEKVYIYENPVGTRYAIRMADENVVLEYKKYYDQYNCQGVFVGIRKSSKNMEKLKKGDAALFMGLFDIPPMGEKLVITPAHPKMKAAGYKM